jgi:hypothetical protein
MIGMDRYTIDINEVKIENFMNIVHDVIESRSELSNFIKNKQQELRRDLTSLLDNVRQEYMHLSACGYPIPG